MLIYDVKRFIFKKGLIENKSQLFAENSIVPLLLAIGWGDLLVCLFFRG